MLRPCFVLAFALAGLFAPLPAQPQDKPSERQKMREGWPAQHAEFWTKIDEAVAQGKRDQALDIAVKLLRLETELLGRDHELAAETSARTADLYWGKREFATAEQYYRDAADRYSNRYGSAHPRVADSRAYARQSAACARLTPEQRTDFHAAERLYDEAQAARSRHEYKRAAANYAQAHAAYTRLFGEQSIHVLFTLTGEGASLWAMKGDLAAADELLTRALPIAENLFGAVHPRPAAIRHDLGLLAADRGDFARAEPLLLKALETRRTVAGAKGADTAAAQQLADSLLRLAVFYRQRRQFATAEKYCTEVGGLYAELHGPDHWLAADARAYARYDAACVKLTRDQLADLLAADKLYDEATALHYTRHEYAAAATKFAEARAAYVRLFGEQSIPGLNSLTGEGSSRAAFRDLAKADELLTRALPLAEAVFGAVHPNPATIRNAIGNVAFDRADYPRAEASFNQALAVNRKVQGAKSVAVAMNLANLGSLHAKLGDYARALPALGEAYLILHANYGLYHADIASVAHMIGRVRADLGDYNAADQLYQMAMTIRQKTIGEKHPAFIQTLNDLACLAIDIGDFEATVRHLNRAVELARLTYGSDSLPLSILLNNFGVVLDRAGLRERAEAVYRRSLEIKTARLGERHPETITVMHNLGSLYLDARKPELAEPLLTKSAALTKEVLGDRHPDYPATFLKLAALHLTKGEYTQAQRDAAAALSARERIFGADHWMVSFDLGVQARVEAATGRPRAALATFEKTMALEDKHLRSVFGFATETAMRLSLEMSNGTLKKVLSLVRDALADDPAALEVALRAVLQRKAGVLDSLCRQREVQALLQGNPEVANHAATVRQLHDKYQRLLAEPPAVGVDPAAHAKQVADLRREYEEWDGRLHRAIERARPKTDVPESAVTLAAIRAKLPADAALVEIIRTEPFDFHATGAAQPWLASHYFAFVLTANPTAPPRLLDLGAADALDAQVRMFRTALTRAPRELKVSSEKQLEADLKDQAGELAARIFVPIAKHLGPAKRLYFAPDGDLNLLPFEALTDDAGRYLLESFQFNYLSSGRDLLRKAAKPATGTTVFAGPDFDWQPSAVTESAKFPPPSAVTRGVPSRSVRGLKWRPLPGAKREADDVNTLLAETRFGPVQVYTGPEARKAQFAKLTTPPRVLHLATHGFYLPERPPTDADARPLVPDGLEAGRSAEVGLPPLLRSGLVLAGANRAATGPPTGPADDGWLTAEEIALMSLRGTELVVLSACETGLGDIHSGEGVFGLRRAFLYAGAQSLVVSLFKVPDEETRELMRSFYQRLKDGQGRLAALHDAKREVIAARRAAHGAAHPFYWASFILVGAGN